jgi:hypothetical protein
LRTESWLSLGCLQEGGAIAEETGTESLRTNFHPFKHTKNVNKESIRKAKKNQIRGNKSSVGDIKCRFALDSLPLRVLAVRRKLADSVNRACP